MTLDLKKYKKLLELDEGAQFIKTDHADAMVADVYKIKRRKKFPLILKICERLMGEAPYLPMNLKAALRLGDA